MTVPIVSFTFDGTQFGYFTLSTESINWLDAETDCIKWNGHLATIRSYQEDSLLLHSLVDIENISCFIGLNDRETDAMTDPNAFVWVDGSDSAYRQFGNSFGLIFPIGSTEGNTDDCVIFGYTLNGAISNGWSNQDCDVERSCYFCSRPGK